MCRPTYIGLPTGQKYNHETNGKDFTYFFVVFFFFGDEALSGLFFLTF